MRTEKITGIALKLSGHHVPNHVLHGTRPFIGEDVGQLVDDDDIASLDEYVLPELDLGLKECRCHLCVPLGAAQLRFERRPNGPGAEPHAAHPERDSLLEPFRGLELARLLRPLLNLWLWLHLGD